MPEHIEAHKLAYVVPTAVVGTDEQGRTLIRCPSCGEDATIMEDGRVACPLGDAILAFFRDAGAKLGATLFGDGAR